MGIIPISASSKITETDNDGNKFFFRYLTGRHSEEFNELQQMMYDVAKPFLEKAKRDVKSEQKGNKIKSGVLEERVGRRAMQLAVDEGKLTANLNSKYSRGMVDLLLCGWEGKGFPPFPKSPEKPSDCLKTSDIDELMVMINKHMNELTGLSVDDKKN